jgi:deoxyribodipyrimidine photo-lyase
LNKPRQPKYLKSACMCFRRDFRLEDNPGLIACLKQSTQVISYFFLDKKQLDQKSNEYLSHNGVQFMCESLIELNESLATFDSRLHIFHGDINEITHHICKEIKPQAIFFNKDVSPHALKRDNTIAEISKKYGMEPYRTMT